jgi:hypothetical protein
MELVLGTSTVQLYGRVTTEDIRDPASPFVVEVTLGKLTLTKKRLSLTRFRSTRTLRPSHSRSGSR